MIKRFLIAVFALALLVPVAHARPVQWSQYHWATNQEPYQINPGYNGTRGSYIQTCLDQWDRTGSLAGSNLVALGSAEQEFPMFDVTTSPPATPTSAYSGVAWIRGDAHGAITGNGATTIGSAPRIEVVGNSSAATRTPCHEIGHLLGFAHADPITGAETTDEVMSYNSAATLPGDEEFGFFDSTIADHLDGYVTLRGPVSDPTTPPPPGDPPPPPPPPPPTPGPTKLVPNADSTDGLWRADGGSTSLYSRLNEGTLPPNLPPLTIDYIRTNQNSEFRVSMANLPLDASGRWDLACYVHINQFGNNVSNYGLRVTRNGVSTSVASVGPVSGRVDGATVGGWQQLTVQNLTVSEVNSLRVTGRKTSGSYYTYVTAATCTVGQALAATLNRNEKRNPFGEVRKVPSDHGDTYIYGLGEGGTAAVHVHPTRGKVRIDPDTKLPVGVVRAPNTVDSPGEHPPPGSPEDENGHDDDDEDDD